MELLKQIINSRRQENILNSGHTLDGNHTSRTLLSNVAINICAFCSGIGQQWGPVYTGREGAEAGLQAIICLQCCVNTPLSKPCVPFFACNICEHFRVLCEAEETTLMSTDHTKFDT